MSRARTGGIVARNKKMYARISYTGDDGRRHTLWRRAKNRTDAKVILRQLGKELDLEQSAGRIVVPPTRGFIYAVQMQIPNVVQSPIKIGISINMQARMDSYATHCPYPVALIGMWESYQIRRTERTVHARFAKQRLRGEWFEPTPELEAFIQEQSLAYMRSLQTQLEASAALCASQSGLDS